MSDNGYMDSFVEENKGRKNEYRESVFSDDEDLNGQTESDTPGHNKKINSFNVSSATEGSQMREKSNNSLSLNFNEFICINNLLASALGGGSFVFPYILYQVGIITSLLIYILVSISVYYSLDLLRRFVVDSNYFSFSFIVQKTLGHLWLKIYTISAFLFYMSCIVNYLDLLFDFNKSMIDFFNDGWGKVIFFLVSCFIEILLCLFTNKISKLHYFSLIVVILFLIITVILIIKSIFDFKNGDFKKLSLFTIEDKFHSKPTNWTSFLFIMSKIIEFFYGFIYHSSFPTLLSGLDNISHSNTRKIQNISYSTLVLIYIIFSFFGCSFYEEKRKEDIIFVDNIDIKNNILKIMFKTILIILLIALIPIRYVVIRDNYTSLFGMEELPLKYEILITSICLLINNLIVYLTGNSKNFISQLIHYFGGALGVFICFVLPVISYISINEKAKLRAIFGYIIGGIFIVIGFFSIFYNFQSKDDGMTN